MSSSSNRKRRSRHARDNYNYPRNEKSIDIAQESNSRASKSPERKRGRSAGRKRAVGPGVPSESSASAAAKASDSSYPGHITTSLNGLSIDFKSLPRSNFASVEEVESDSKKRRRHVVSPGRSNRHSQKSRRSHESEEDVCPLGSHYRSINSVLREAHSSKNSRRRENYRTTCGLF